MRKIDLEKVRDAVRELFISACLDLPLDVRCAIERARDMEQSPLGREILTRIVDNSLLAEEKRLPICQDTGVATVYLAVGTEVVFEGDLYQAVNEGVRLAYTEGYLRKSIVRHPLDRVNTGDNTPAVIHTEIVSGDTFRIDVTAKGGGSENMCSAKMLIPADGVEGVKKFVLDTVTAGGGKPCPPIIVGVGIGGNFEKCVLLSKEALLRDLSDESEDELSRELERELFSLINDTGIGPMGLGGRATCLSVKVNTYPCHIASLPVAVSIQCHAARHKSREL